MSSITAQVCEILLRASSPMSAAELASALKLDRQKIHPAIFSLKAAGAVTGIEVTGEPLRYQVANQDALRARVNGKARKGRRNQNKQTAEAPAAKKKKTKHRKAAAPQVKEPLLSFFIGEDSELQIVRADGEGEAAVLPADEALRLSAFIEKHRAALEAA